jgi:hypothetical protein
MWEASIPKARPYGSLSLPTPFTERHEWRYSQGLTQTEDYYGSSKGKAHSQSSLLLQEVTLLYVTAKRKKMYIMIIELLGL